MHSCKDKVLNQLSKLCMGHLQLFLAQTEGICTIIIVYCYTVYFCAETAANDSKSDSFYLIKILTCFVTIYADSAVYI